jgi:hypothetical protein
MICFTSSLISDIFCFIIYMPISYEHLPLFPKTQKSSFFEILTFPTSQFLHFFLFYCSIIFAISPILRFSLFYFSTIFAIFPSSHIFHFFLFYFSSIFLIIFTLTLEMIIRGICPIFRLKICST